MKELFEIALLISCITLGVRAITDRGMIFYFMREWVDRIENEKILSAAFIPKYRVAVYAMKPVLTCSTCMASVHTFIWFPIFTGGFDLWIVPTMLIGAFFNSIGWSFLNLLRKLHR
jgi:hypothetical protein